MNEHCRHAICEFEGDGHNGTLARTTTFSAVSHIRFFFVLLKYNGNNKSPRFRHTYNILYMCVCVCYNTRYSGKLQLLPLSDFMKYVLRGGVGKNYPLHRSVPLEIVCIWVSRRLRSPDGTHTHNFATTRRGPDDDNAKLYYYLTKVPTAARLFYNVNNYCGDGDRDYGTRHRCIVVRDV